MRLSILVPYAPDGGGRDRAWAWNRQRLELTMPDAEFVVAEAEAENPGLFNYTATINRAAAQATGDVFMVGDVDTAVEAADVLVAADRVLEQRTWARTTVYHKLTPPETDRVLSCHPTVALDRMHLDTEWSGTTSWGGPLIIPREGWDLVGGFDERHTAYGFCDACIGLALGTLWAPEIRSGPAWHLWHPQPLDHTFGQPHTHEQRDLFYRYQAAAGDPAAMRDLVNR